MKAPLPFDIVAAAILFLTSISFSIHTFSVLQRQEQPALVPFAVFEEGESTYRLLWNTQCVGFMRTNLTKDGESARLTLRGDLRVVARGREHTARFSVQSSFNPLGQLYAGLAELAVDKFSAALTSQQVKPIELKLNLRADEWRPTYAFQVEGPMVLLREQSGSFTLRYPLRRVAASRGMEEWARGVADHFKVGVKASTDACATHERGAIATDQFQNLLNSLPITGLSP